MSFAKLYQALKEGNTSKVRDSIRNGVFADGDLEQVVALAVYHEQPGILDILLESGLSPNVAHTLIWEDSQKKVYPLSLACRLTSETAPRMTKMLIEYGARVDYPMYGRYVETSLSDPQITPFIHMLHNSNFQHIQAFLDAGIDPLYMHTKNNHPVPAKSRASKAEFLLEPRRDVPMDSVIQKGARNSVDPLNTWHYLIFHLQHIDAEIINVLLHAGGIVPETEQAAMHSIFLRYMMYITHNTHVSACIVENLLLLLLETNFSLHKEEFIELLYKRFRKENGYENIVPELAFDPCRPDTDPIYQQQKEALSSVDELFVTTMWNLKIYVKRLELTPKFLEHFFERFTRPKSLVNQCRLVIRSALGRIQLRTKIEKLPLPSDLRQFVYHL